MITRLIKISALLFHIFYTSFLGQSNTYTVQTNEQLPPFSWTGTGIVSGNSVDILQEIALIQNFDVNISSSVSSSIYQNLAKKRIDIGASLVYDTTHSRGISYSSPVAWCSYDIFSTLSDALLRTENLAGKKVYLVKDDPVLALLERDYPSTTFLYHESLDKILSLMETGELRYAVLPKQSAVIISEYLGFNNIIYNRLLDYSIPVCYAVNEENTKLLSLINEGLTLLKLSGKYDELAGDFSNPGNTSQLWYQSRYFVMLMIVLINVLVISIIWLVNFRNKVARNESNLYSVLDKVPHQISLKDSAGKFIFVNRAFAELYRKDPIFFKDKTQKEIHTSEIEIQKFCEIEKRLYDPDNTLTQMISEESFSFAGGIKKTFQFTRLLIDANNEEDKKILSLGIDITDRVNNLSLLERSERKFKLLFENAGLSVFLHRFDGTFVDVNEYALKSLGYSKDEILKLKAWDIEKGFTPFGGTQVIESLEENESYETEGFHVRKDGSGFRVLARLAIVKLENEKLVLAMVSNIEEQKRKEDRIKLQNTALNAAANGIAIVDVEGHFVWVNKSFTTLTGYSRQEIIGQHTRILNSGYQDNLFYKNLWDIVLSGREWNGIFVNKKKDGTLYSEEATITPVYDDNTVLTHFVSVKTDITQRLKIEQQIRESEQRYKYLFSKAPIGIFQFNSDLILEAFNDHFINIFRSTREKLQNLNLDNLVDQSFVPNLRSTLKGIDTSYNGQYHTTTSDADIYISLHTRAFYDEKNRIIGGIGIVEDITMIKEIEMELKQSEKKYRSIFENLMDVYYMTNLDGEIVNISPSAKKLLNISDHRTLINRTNISEFYVFPGERAKLLNDLDQNGYIKNYNIDLKRPDGKIIHVELHSHYVRDKDDTPVAIEGMMRDITDRKIAEEELRAGEQKLRNIVENSSDGIVLVNHKGKIVEWNTAAESITSYGKSEVIDKYIWDVHTMMAPENVDLEAYKSLMEQTVIQSLKTGKIVRGSNIQEARIIRRDGKEIFTQSSVAIISTPQGNMVVSILRDVSTLKEAENQLKLAKERAEKSNRLKSEFLAQMSHEIRTPVNAILSFAGLMEEELKEKLEIDLQDGFRAMRSAGNRIIRTIDLILNMSEIQTGTYDYNRSEIDLYIDILVNLSAEHKTMLKNKNLQLDIHKPEIPAVVYGDEYTVNQIFNNLIDNAIKYTPEGKIDISFEHAGNKITVYIRDTGIGISEEYIPYLFEAFTQEEQGYTRKFEGNGLGLALVKKYCSLNNADIQVSSQKGEGTEFAVIFNID